MLVRRLDRLNGPKEGGSPSPSSRDGWGEAGLVPAPYIERLDGKAAKAVEPFAAQ
jgi:hypothetical protein